MSDCMKCTNRPRTQCQHKQIHTAWSLSSADTVCIGFEKGTPEWVQKIEKWEQTPFWKNDITLY